MKEQGKDFDPSKEPIIKETMGKISGECKRLFGVVGGLSCPKGKADFIRGTLIFSEPLPGTYSVGDQRDVWITKGTIHNSEYLHPGKAGYSVYFPGSKRIIVDDNRIRTYVSADLAYHVNTNAALMVTTLSYRAGYLDGSAVREGDWELFFYGIPTNSEKIVHREEFPLIKRVANELIGEFYAGGQSIETESKSDYPEAAMVLKGEVPSPIKPSEEQGNFLFELLKSVRGTVGYSRKGMELLRLIKENPPM